MGLAGRYFSERDLLVLGSFNNELLDDLIQTVVTVYKICADQTLINLYGESDPTSGKMFYPGVELTVHIKREDITSENSNFGPTRKQDVEFRFLENSLKLVNLFPEQGDIISFNDRYHEIDNVVQEQFLGGISDKSFSIICNTHYSRLSKLSLIKR